MSFPGINLHKSKWYWLLSTIHYFYTITFSGKISSGKSEEILVRWRKVSPTKFSSIRYLLFKNRFENESFFLECFACLHIFFLILKIRSKSKMDLWYTLNLQKTFKCCRTFTVNTRARKFVQSIFSLKILRYVQFYSLSFGEEFSDISKKHSRHPLSQVFVISN